MDKGTGEALDAIEKHFSTLTIGQGSHQEHVYTEEEARFYADRYDLAYPGIYRTPDGELLVPPGMIFMRPAGTFGITSPDSPPLSRGGIYTRACRRYHQFVCVGRTVVFDGRITDTYERRGYYYIAVGWEARDDSGLLLAEGEEWHTLGSVRKTS